ncbi:MAG: T9SS type A sorting domain-containing protein [Caldithrix sp.]|nr:T9SS type A sorting domain-containing protein [Caldithrix sp.]
MRRHKMKTYNHLIIFFMILIIFSQSGFADNYTVEIVMKDMRAMQGRPQEWQCNLYSNLYKNGNYIEPQANYTYSWYIKDVNENDFKKGVYGTGIDYSERPLDGMYNQHFDNYVAVEGPDFFVTSEVLTVGKDGSAHEVTLLATSEDGTDLQLTEYIHEFTNPNWRALASSNSVYFFLDEDRTLWTSTRIVENINEKYHKWSTDEDPYINYHSYFIGPYTNIIETNTEKICSASLQTEVLSGGSGIKIGLKDPWYADGTELGGIKKNRGSNALWYDYEQLNITKEESDPYKGVIQELGPLEDLYYSLRAPKQQIIDTNGRDINYFFIGWNTNEQATIDKPDHTETINNVEYYTSPVIFHDENAQIKATYKGHLASSNSRATGHNNGRRICRTQDDNLHLVYEDDGSIWYSKSTDGGDTWSQDQRISPVKTQERYCLNPAITQYSNQLFVVWERVDVEEYADDHYIVWYKNEDGVWQDKTIISEDDFNVDQTDNPDCRRPAIAAADIYEVVVAWRDLDNNKIKVRHYDNNSEEWSAIDEINTDAYPVCGMSSPQPENDDDFPVKIVWAKDGHIYYKAGQKHDNGYWSWETTVNLTGDMPFYYSDHLRPSLAMDIDNHGHLAWEGDDDLMAITKNIFYQQYDFSVYPPQTIGSLKYVDMVDLGNDNICDATIGAENDLITIFYQKFDKVYRKQKESGSWSKRDFGSGRYASIGENTSSGTVWTKYVEAPYLIKNDYIDPNGTPLPPGEELPITPILSLTYTLDAADNGGEDGYINVQLQQTTLDGDTLWFDDELASDSLLAEISQMPLDLTLQVKHYNVNVPPNAQDMLFKMDFIDGDQSINLTDIRYYELPDSGTYIKNVTVNNLHTREGFVQVSFPQLQPFTSFMLQEDDQQQSKRSRQLVSRYIPENFHLSPNYPNPFNPITHIKFELPEASHVTLQIVDVNGKVVSTEINDYRPAGVHETIFDGKNLSSGIYFYRIRAGNFVQTKRMLLVK